MAFEVVGKLIKVLPAVTGSGKNGPWNKQDFVLETFDSQYPKKICMSIWGEKANDLNQYAIGDSLKATFSAESREYNDRWYTELRAFRLELGEAAGDAAPARPAAASQPQQRPTSQGSPASVAFNAAFDEESNDLPF